jgi:N-acyl-D-aspartate/D-glutamate deacylase
MAYDLLIKNGRIVDGSGMPSFIGDLAVKDGKIAELGKLSGAAGQTVDAGGQVIAPGFIDNHCHYDAQVTWDPLCSFSCDHGAPSVVIGNCSLSLAPVRKGNATRMAEFLSYVEAIPMEVLNTIEVDWESFPQYMDRLDKNLGVNVGTLIGHTAVRYYVMRDECQKRAATDAEIKEMQAVVRDGMEGGALGLLGVAQPGPLRPAGRPYPGDLGGREGDFRDCRRAARTRHRHHPVRRWPRRRDEEWADGAALRSDRPPRHLQQSGPERAPPRRVAEAHGAGQRNRGARHPRLPTVLAEHHDDLQHEEHAGLPRLADLAPDPLEVGRREAQGLCFDPAVRRKLHEEMVEWKVEIPGNTISREWYNYIWVEEPVLDKNKWMKGKTINQVAQAQNKGIIDAFLDLVVEEKRPLCRLRTTSMSTQ